MALSRPVQQEPGMVLSALKLLFHGGVESYLGAEPLLEGQAYLNCELAPWMFYISTNLGLSLPLPHYA